MTGSESADGFLIDWSPELIASSTCRPRSISTQTYRSALSAQLSVPTLLESRSVSTLPPTTVHPSALAASAGPPPPIYPPGSSYLTWTTDLARTEPFWEGWYTGLSKAFLVLDVPRMLVLAGQDRMDKELMIGQMQGASPFVRRHARKPADPRARLQASFSMSSSSIAATTSSRTTRAGWPSSSSTFGDVHGAAAST